MSKKHSIFNPKFGPSDPKGAVITCRSFNTANTNMLGKSNNEVACTMDVGDNRVLQFPAGTIVLSDISTHCRGEDAVEVLYKFQFNGAGIDIKERSGPRIEPLRAAINDLIGEGVINGKRTDVVDMWEYFGIKDAHNVKVDLPTMEA